MQFTQWRPLILQIRSLNKVEVVVMVDLLRSSCMLFLVIFRTALLPKHPLVSLIHFFVLLRKYFLLAVSNLKDLLPIWQTIFLLLFFHLLTVINDNLSSTRDPLVVQRVHQLIVVLITLFNLLIVSLHLLYVLVVLTFPHIILHDLVQWLLCLLLLLNVRVYLWIQSVERSLVLIWVLDFLEALTWLG